VKLRPYQQQAIDALWAYLPVSEGNPALVLPTGAGKSPLMAAIAREAVERWGGRVGILAHVQELVSQNADKLRALWPDAPLGIHAAGLKRRDRFDRILMMQIQSVATKAHTLGKFDLLLVDEAHRIPLKGEGMYRQFIADALKVNPNLRVIGLTATPYRLQGAAVPVCGPENILTEVAFEVGVRELIDAGFLSALVTKGGERPDLSGVQVRGGEYVEAGLAQAVMAGDLVPRTVRDLLNRTHGRRAGIVFCVNVAHADAVLAALRAAGETAALVHGGTPKGERMDLIADFQKGALRWMVNVNVLSEGFDAPHIDCVAMLRPTKSPGMYYQQAGRGFRLAEGKKDCLVLDYAGNTIEHGPIDTIKPTKPRAPGAKQEEGPRAKQCPSCTALLALGTRTCPECEHVFSAAEVAHETRPVDAPILGERPVLVRHAISSISYAMHVGKASGKPSLRVTYRIGIKQVSEYVCVEHDGTARLKALRWWQSRAERDPITGRPSPMPSRVAEALAKCATLHRPTHLTVSYPPNGYPEIVEHGFDAREKAQPDFRVAGIAAPDRVDASANAVRRVPALQLEGRAVRAVEVGSTAERAA